MMPVLIPFFYGGLVVRRRFLMSSFFLLETHGCSTMYSSKKELATFLVQISLGQLLLAVFTLHVYIHSVRTPCMQLQYLRRLI